jgi:hypothetical protein
MEFIRLTMAAITTIAALKPGKVAVVDACFHNSGDDVTFPDEPIKIVVKHTAGVIDMCPPAPAKYWIESLARAGLDPNNLDLDKLWSAIESGFKPIT